MGIAVKTFLADIAPEDEPAVRQSKLDAFPGSFVPNAINFPEDLDTSLAFFDALFAGIENLNMEMSVEDKAAWREAKQYRELRRL